MSSEREVERISDIEMYSAFFRLSDAKLRTDDGCTFDIHRAVLAANCDKFRSMFCGTDKKEFTIPGMSGECLNSILFYIYTGDIRVSKRNVRDLMIAADYLLLKDLHMEIRRSINDNMTELNCLGILKAAHQISDMDTFQECFRFIQTRFERVARCQKDELADLPLEILKSILSSRSLCVYGETTVWQVIVEWTQKDTPSRMCCVPTLLLTLAMKEVGEELAKEILQHETISENFSMKYLRSSNNFTNNHDVFLSFLRSYSNPLTQPYSYRIPLHLHVISSYDIDYGEEGKSTLYITYDENPDLWRKITEVDSAWEFLISKGHNIYIFDTDKSTCKNFDLSLMDWVAMEKMSYSCRGSCVEPSCVDIDSYIYILGQMDDDDEQTYVVEVYDTANNRWFNGVSIPNICDGASVAIEKKIYFVGNDDHFMMTRMFDPATQQWSLLPPPNVNRSFFKLLAYHQKMYLIGGIGIGMDVRYKFSNVEVFDTATKVWKELPNLPYDYFSTRAVVFNDQIIVFDGGANGCSKNSVRWNNQMECWENLDKTYTLKDLHFCSIYDADTIRMITKLNRDPKTQMEKSHFI